MDKRYRFILLSNDSGERIELTNAPIGWDATKINIVRDITYLGILKTITVEFGFLGDGFKWLQKQRLRYGWDASVLIRIYKVKANEFLFEGKINMVPTGAEIRKFNRFKCDIIQSSEVQKFQTREQMELNVLNPISLDQLPYTPFNPVSATIRGKMIQFYSQFDGSMADEPNHYHHILPFEMKQNGNPGVKVATGIAIDGNGLTPDSEYPNMPFELREPDFAHFVNDLLEPQPIKLKFNINYTSTNKAIVSLPYHFPGVSGSLPEVTYYPGYRLSLAMYNADNSLNSILWESKREMTFGNFTHTQEYNINVPPGAYIIFGNWLTMRTTDELHYPAGFLVNEAMGPPFDMTSIWEGLKIEFTYNTLQMEIWQDSVVQDSVHPVMLPHELFSNLTTQICGLPLYSEVFGRVDLGYEADGEFALLATTLGAWLRGIEMAKTQYSSTFRDAFKSYHSVCCLGIQITNEYVWIDTLDKMFNYNIAARIGEVEEFEVQPLTEFMYNRIKAGYPNNEYEQQNGRDEFNTTYYYSLSIQCVDKELDLLSKFCGDGYGIEFSRRAGILNTGSADSRYDDKVFFVDLINDDGLKSRRLEGINNIGGIFSPETVLNARIAVGQNMLRHKKFINVTLDKKPDKVIHFQSKDKNTDFYVSTELGESFDGEDIKLGTRSYFIPDAHIFKNIMPADQLPGIIANPLGVIEYTYGKEKFHDFILTTDVETEKATGRWRMMATKSTPPDVDPDTFFGNVIKYNDGLEDFVKYNDEEEDFIQYAD